MKIGVYAGSFNPIHNAHLDIAGKIIDSGMVDRVIFVPVGDSYEKPNLVNGNKRYAMIELAIKDNCNLSVSNIEIESGKLYTYETLDYFKSKYINDEIYFVLGSDNLSEFHLWKRYQYILDNYGLVVLLRNNDKKENFVNYINNDKVVFVDYDFNLSSTEIREEIKKEKYNEVSLKIHEDVFSYIKEYRLYE